MPCEALRYRSARLAAAGGSKIRLTPRFPHLGHISAACAVRAEPAGAWGTNAQAAPLDRA
jgi:hypothetical protein